MDYFPSENPQAQTNFQLPNFVQPRSYQGLNNAASGTLDAIFNQQIRNKLLQKQQIENQSASLGLQNQQLDQATSLGAVGMTPQDLQGATPGDFGNAANPQMTQSDGGQPQQQFDNPTHAHVVQGLQRLIAAKKASISMGIAGQEAGIAKTQGEAAKTGAEARRTNIVSDMISGAGQDPQNQGRGMIQDVLAKVANGQMTPAQADDWFGRNPDVHLGYMAQAGKSPIDFAQQQRNADTQGAGMKASETLTQGGSSQQGARSALSLNKAVDKLLSISQQFPRADKQFLNTPIMQLQTKFGSGPNSDLAARLNYALAEIRSQASSVMAAGGAPQESVEKELSQKIPDSITPSQLTALAPDIKDFGNMRAESLLTPATTKNIPAQSKSQGSSLTGNAKAAKILKNYQSGKIDRTQATNMLRELKNGNGSGNK